MPVGAGDGDDGRHPEGVKERRDDGGSAFAEEAGEEPDDNPEDGHTDRVDVVHGAACSAGYVTKPMMRPTRAPAPTIGTTFTACWPGSSVNRL